MNNTYTIAFAAGLMACEEFSARCRRFNDDGPKTQRYHFARDLHRQDKYAVTQKSMVEYILPITSSRLFSSCTAASEIE